MAEPTEDRGGADQLSAFELPLNPLGLADPFHWLALGWRDFRQQPALGLFYGFCFMAMGWALLETYQRSPAWILWLSAGFLLLGPLLCMGLYQVSLRLERGQAPSLVDSLTAWRVRTGQLAIFGFALLILEMLWGRSALVVFAVSFDGMPELGGSLLKLLEPENFGFIVSYLCVGAVFAGLIFAISVISIPMILDEQVDAITAALTSLRLCLTQPGVMLLWGALITLLILVAMLPGFAGLLVAGPVIGHASWHAYRAAVGAR